MSNESPTDALRLVPVEPTWDQLVAMRDCCAELSGIEADSETMLTALYRAALKAAPASPLPGGGWQDISTAPKDGTEVLVMLKPKVIRLGWYFKPSSRTEGWCDENGKRIIPSHWMPLPAAPTGAA